MAAVGDIIQLVVTTKLNQQTCMNVLHYRIQSLPSGTTGNEAAITELIGAFITGTGSVVNKMKAIMSEDAIIETVQGQIVYPTRTIYYLGFANSQGLLLTPALPPACSLAITKRSATVGRGRAGRVEIAGCPAAEAFQGSWQTGGTFWTDVMNLANQLEATQTGPVLSIVYEPVIFRRSSPITSAVVADMTPQTTVRSEKRRVVGRGI
jgi:hypothetical protein